MVSAIPILSPVYVSSIFTSRHSPHPLNIQSLQFFAYTFTIAFVLDFIMISSAPSHGVTPRTLKRKPGNSRISALIGALEIPPEKWFDPLDGHARHGGTQSF